MSDAPEPAGPAAAARASERTAPVLEASDGQALRISFAVDPVLNLKAGAIAGHRIESRVLNLQTGQELTPEQRRILMPRDFEAVDLAALDRAASRLGSELPTDRPTLILQMSFASLGNGRARMALINRAREIEDLLKRAAICELVDLDAGLPAGRMAEVAALVRPAFRSVWTQVTSDRGLIDAARGARVSGLTVRAAELGSTPREIVRGMARFMGLAKGAAASITVTGLPGTALLVDAGQIGFTHATLHAPRPGDSSPGRPAP